MRISKSATDEIVTTEENIKVADMNIEGMPWYVTEKYFNSENKTPTVTFSRKEIFKLMFYAVGTALIVGCIFLFVLFLFLLFCQNIWFQ